MNTIFEKGEQIEYTPTYPEQIFRIDYQKKVKVGDIIEVDRVLKHGEEFGQPYLKGVTVHLKIIKDKELDKKIVIGKKKPKKRYELKKGYRAKFTTVQVVKIEDQRKSEKSTKEA